MEEPQLTLTIAEKRVDFLGNTGATYSVLNTQQDRMTEDKFRIMGVEAKPQEHDFI